MITTSKSSPRFLVKHTQWTTENAAGLHRWPPPLMRELFINFFPLLPFNQLFFRTILLPQCRSWVFFGAFDNRFCCNILRWPRWHLRARCAEAAVYFPLRRALSRERRGLLLSRLICGPLNAVLQHWQKQHASSWSWSPWVIFSSFFNNIEKKKISKDCERKKMRKRSASTKLTYRSQAVSWFWLG